MVSKNEPLPETNVMEERTAHKPDHDAYPSLPGTPEPHISEFEITVKQPKRKSLPPELMSKRTKKEVSIYPRSTVRSPSIGASISHRRDNLESPLSRIDLLIEAVPRRGFVRPQFKDPITPELWIHGKTESSKRTD